MKWNPEKKCITNDDGSLIKPLPWHTDRDGAVSCSIAARYPLDCDHVGRNGGKSCDKMPFVGGSYQAGLCEQARKRLDRWHNYLQKELA
jgi:hypothetical protein